MAWLSIRFAAMRAYGLSLLLDTSLGGIFCGAFDPSLRGLRGGLEAGSTNPQIIQRRPSRTPSSGGTSSSASAAGGGAREHDHPTMQQGQGPRPRLSPTIVPDRNVHATHHQPTVTSAKFSVNLNSNQHKKRNFVSAAARAGAPSAASRTFFRRKKISFQLRSQPAAARTETQILVPSSRGGARERSEKEHADIFELDAAGFHELAAYAQHEAVHSPNKPHAQPAGGLLPTSLLECVTCPDVDAPRVPPAPPAVLGPGVDDAPWLQAAVNDEEREKQLLHKTGGAAVEVHSPSMPVFHGRNAEIFGAPKNRYGIDSAVGSHPPSVPDQEMRQGPVAPELIDDDGDLDGRQDVVKIAREQDGEAPQKASQTNRTATPTNEQASKWASAPRDASDLTRGDEAPGGGGEGVRTSSERTEHKYTREIRVKSTSSSSSDTTTSSGRSARARTSWARVHPRGHLPFGRHWTGHRRTADEGHQRVQVQGSSHRIVHIENDDPCLSLVEGSACQNKPRQPDLPLSFFQESDDAQDEHPLPYAPAGPGDHTEDGFFVAEDGGIKRPLVVVTFGDGVRSEELDESVIPMSVKEAPRQRPRRYRCSCPSANGDGEQLSWTLFSSASGRGAGEGGEAATGTRQTQLCSGGLLTDESAQGERRGAEDSAVDSSRAATPTETARPRPVVKRVLCGSSSTQELETSASLHRGVSTRSGYNAVVLITDARGREASLSGQERPQRQLDAAIICQCPDGSRVGVSRRSIQHSALAPHVETCMGGELLAVPANFHHENPRHDQWPSRETPPEAGPGGALAHEDDVASDVVVGARVVCDGVLIL